LLAGAVGALLLLPDALRAQDGPTFIYATYHKCEIASEAGFDAIRQSVTVPVLEAMLADGEIVGWASLEHHTGGAWRRAGVLAASSVDALLDAQSRLASETSHVRGALFTICPSHDDYIWESVVASAPISELLAIPRDAGYSFYAVCDMTREARADELMTDVFAPIINSHVGEGMLTGWGWWKHHTGGKYRRLLAYRGADHKAVAAHRQAILDEILARQPEAFAEFTSICGSHADYLWDIQTG
jgi:hypothetical protein